MEEKEFPCSNVAVVWHERRLGLERARELKISEFLNQYGVRQGKAPHIPKRQAPHGTLSVCAGTGQRVLGLHT